MSGSDCIKEDLPNLAGVAPTEYFRDRNEFRVGEALLAWYSKRDERGSLERDGVKEGCGEEGMGEDTVRVRSCCC